MCYATGIVPCCDACDEAGQCLLSCRGENERGVTSRGEGAVNATTNQDAGDAVLERLRSRSFNP